MEKENAESTKGALNLSGQFQYDLTNYSMFLPVQNYSETMQKRLSNYNIARTNKLSLNVGGSSSDVLRELEGFGEILNFGGEEAWVFHDKFIYYLDMNATGKNTNLQIRIMYEDCDDKIFKQRDEAQSLLEEQLGELILQGEVVEIVWQIFTDGYTKSMRVTEVLDDIIYPEAYPYVDIEEYISAYLESDESILLLKGAPGTGKTRLARYVMKEFSGESNDDAVIMFANQKKVIESGSIFQKFFVKSSDMMVLEDIDYALKPGNGSSQGLAPILNAADGLINSRTKKMIITTNLPNVDHLDKALTRPGRCFGVLELRPLTKVEGKALAEQINPNHNGIEFPSEQTLAEIYRRAKDPENKSPGIPKGSRVGFGR